MSSGQGQGQVNFTLSK